MNANPSNNTQPPDLTIPPHTPQTSKRETSEWPLLLKNYDSLVAKCKDYTPLPVGYSPLNRPIQTHLKYGVINLDKPSNPSSHEIVSWVKRILNLKKTGHSGTLDPKVTGNLLIFLDKATRLSKSMQESGKEYVCVIRFHSPITQSKFSAALDFFKGPLLQRPPLICAVKRRLRVRRIISASVIDFDCENQLAVFSCRCQSGTYIRTLCSHIGMHLGVGAHMQELRRTKTGFMGEKNDMVTMHDILDAEWVFKNRLDESYLRRVVQPLEVVLVNMKRLVVKDTSVSAVCHGAYLMLPGLLRFEEGIKCGDQVVLITTKGEAIAIGKAMMSSLEMNDCEHGKVALLVRVIMERDLYPKKWGLGPYGGRTEKQVKTRAQGIYNKVNNEKLGE